ncbi:MAG: phosphatase PAP2 family protein [Actinobacteria bacterium]|nr:phosphatase PAP2 family protein [Actinomycetota bacterium]
MAVAELPAARRVSGRRRWVPPWPRAGRVLAAVRALDDRVDNWVERHRNPRLDPFFYRLSSAADHGLLWTALGGLRSARAGDPVPGLRLGAAMGIESALTNGPIKACFRRIRPPHQPDGPLPYGMHRPRTSAFPSGHATSAFTAATLLSQGTNLGPLYFGLAGLVASSRVYTRMHHASDVLAGAALGLAFGQIAKRLLPMHPRSGPPGTG